jgi:hypothetical protein
MVIRFSALRDGRALRQGRFLIPIYVRGCISPRVIVRLAGLGELKKNSLTSSVIEPAIFRLIVCRKTFECPSDRWLLKNDPVSWS